MAKGIAEFVCNKPNWFDKKLWKKGEILKCAEANASRIPHHFSRVGGDVEEENPSVINVDSEIKKLTNKQIMTILDAKGIEYPNKPNRATLLSLIELIKEGIEFPGQGGSPDE